MIEVTAEMIERGRGVDRRVTAERRRLNTKVQEAREKLTSSGSGHRAFDMELLKLYASRRMAASPGLALLALAFAAFSMRWASWPVLVVWLSVTGIVLILGHWLAERFLDRVSVSVNVKRWSRGFILAETFQGCCWAGVIAVTSQTVDPHATLFMLVVMLLVAGMNATVTASLPFAVYGGLAPMTVAIVAILHPTSLSGDNTLFATLVVGTQVSFAYLARKLYHASLEALSFQAEKDLLIDELEQSRVNSDLARSRAEESNLAKSRFLATMSHELRTPLNAILGFSEVMKAELFGQHAVPAYRDYANDIHSSGEHLLMLINEILDLSRVEAGRYELQEESVDLQGLVDECRHLMVIRAKKKDIVILQAHSEMLPGLWADRRALRQVVLNLLSNAIKFTPPGGQVRVISGATPEGGQFFSIQDTGAGIPESEIPVVMSSFGRGSLAQKNAEEGTGLGLPIVKGLVELHGGTFDLKSRVREGTDVTVTFPPERVMNALPRLDIETMDQLADQSIRSAA